MKNKQLEKHYSGEEPHYICLTCKAITNNELKEEFLEIIKNMIADIEYDMKNSQELAKVGEPEYWEGHWVGIDQVRVDYLLPLKEKLENGSMSDL